MTGSELFHTSIMPEDLCLCILASERSFYENDKELLNYGASGNGSLGEWSLVFRFGYYLQKKLSKFPKYKYLYLDSEYNRHGDSQKYDLDMNKKVRPDLCLHERRTDNNNLLVIEFKKSTQDGNQDIAKLQMFTTPITQDTQRKMVGYGYKFGLFISISQKKFDYQLFLNGVEHS